MNKKSVPKTTSKPKKTSNYTQLTKKTSKQIQKPKPNFKTVVKTYKDMQNNGWVLFKDPRTLAKMELEGKTFEIGFKPDKDKSWNYTETRCLWLVKSHEFRPNLPEIVQNGAEPAPKELQYRPTNWTKFKEWVKNFWNQVQKRI